MAYDEALAERISTALAGRVGFAEKKMFGGIGFLLNGNMCVGVWKDQLILRLSAEQADAALEQEHVHVFDITGRAMTGWVLVDPAGMRKDGELRAWIEQSVEFVSLLPAK
jgi:TfoX/Sxy family transcriptional regulator of competence genes